MANFLQKLKRRNVNTEPIDGADQKQQSPVTPAKHPTAKALEGASQLDVDIFQTSAAITIYAQLAGAGVHDFSVLIEGDGDIVTIRGQRIRPNGDIITDDKDHDTEHLVEECAWGKFYRQIILPTEVEASKTEAKMKNGVLVISLPLKEATGGGVKINVTEV